jgi:hypothetical protein
MVSVSLPSSMSRPGRRQYGCMEQISASILTRRSGTIRKLASRLPNCSRRAQWAAAIS